MTIRKKQRLSLDEIHEGMIVAEPVFFEEDRPVFFSEGSIVTARLIRWLKRAGQMELSVYVEEQPVVPKEAAGRTYQLLLGGMQDIFQSLLRILIENSVNVASWRGHDAVTGFIVFSAIALKIA